MAPPEILRWLARAWSGIDPTPDQFNWGGLAGVAASEAQLCLDRVESLRWAEVSVSIYDGLGNGGLRQPGFVGRLDSFQYSAMNLRAVMIVRYGASPGHNLLDPAIVIQWFYSILPMSCEGAAAILEGSTVSELGEVAIELRQVRRALSPGQRLIGAGRLIPDAEVSCWLRLERRLP
ncbi:MAG TPA: hypothetical protein VFJ58_03055 [Armatimonadota bacterium]|nr:hypothetical protein [Armatimonadota bacterium]